MRSVNTVVIPELSENLIIQSIRTAHEDILQRETAERGTAMDFYYHHDVDKHIDEWFSKSDKYIYKNKIFLNEIFLQYS